MRRLLVVFVFVCQTLVAPIAFGATGLHASAFSADTPASMNHAAHAAHADTAQHAHTGPGHFCCEPGGHCSPGIVQLQVAQPGIPAPARTRALPARADLRAGISIMPYRPPSLTS